MNSFENEVDVNVNTDAGVNRIDDGRTKRLQQAVKSAGGRTTVIKKSGVPAGTLNGYLSGVEIKANNLVAIADACGVAIEWLAAGRGPREPGAAWPTEHARLYPTVDLPRLAGALDLAEAGFQRRGSAPDSLKRAEIIVVIYDILENQPADIVQHIIDFGAPAKSNTP